MQLKQKLFYVHILQIIILLADHPEELKHQLELFLLHCHCCHRPWYQRGRYPEYGASC
jgi:hypothetical protein